MLFIENRFAALHFRDMEAHRHRTATDIHPDDNGVILFVTGRKEGELTAKVRELEGALAYC